MDITERNLKVKLRKQKRKIGSVQRTILLLLLGGVALSCARTAHLQWRIIKGVHQELKKLRRQAAERAIASLYESQLIEARRNSDGTHTVILSAKGKKRALTYRTYTMKIKPMAPWDGKWRIVLYDIPEDEREARDAFRGHLSRLGLHKLQQSAGVTPFRCEKEIEFIVELLDIRKYVRHIVADKIDNEKHLRQIFGLPSR